MENIIKILLYNKIDITEKEEVFLESLIVENYNDFLNIKLDRKLSVYNFQFITRIIINELDINLDLTRINNKDFKSIDDIRNYIEEYYY